MPYSHRNTPKRFKKQDSTKVVNYGTSFEKYANAVTVEKNWVVPDRYRTTISYSTEQAITLDGDLIEEVTYSGNSAFDPYVTGVGASALGFVKLSTLYDKYTVRASTIRVGFTCFTLLNPLRCCVRPTTVDTPATGWEDVVGNAFAIEIVTNSEGDLNRTIETTMSTDKILGLPIGTYRIDSNYSGLTTGDPPVEWYWKVYCTNAENGSGLTTPATMNVTITYDVEFYSRTALTNNL